MSAETKQIIIELWEQTGKESAGATELGQIQQALLARPGTGMLKSPASIARVLADHGVPLQHPGILEADLAWRQEQMSALFRPEELNLDTLQAATSLIEKIERLGREFEGNDALLGHLRRSVRKIKDELDLFAARERVEKETQLAQELAQWLLVWLQNPQIFREWLELRRSTAEFQEHFG